jgi:hypothetical protein
MSVILTLTATMTGGAMTLTTSGIALTDILKGAAISIGALIFLLTSYDVMSRSDSWNPNIKAALRTMCVPLVVIFCAFLAFEAARLL